MLYSKDIEENLRQRATLLLSAHTDVLNQKLIFRQCKEDPLFFFNMFLWTYKPKAVGDEGEPENPNFPFITYEFQDDFITDLIWCIENQQDNSTQKSREMGFSWMVLGVFTWGFLFRGWATLVGSYKLEYVDALGSMDSSLERIRFMLDRLPSWMKPDDIISKHKSISSKNLGAEIGGDVGENFGTGGRRKAIFMDEFPLWRDDEKAFRKTKDVTNCRIIGGCITSDSMIIGEKGIEELGEINDGYSLEDKLVYGKGGFHNAIQRFGNGYVDTIKIVNNLGMRIEGTPNHRLLTKEGWKKLDEIKVGDNIYVQSGQNIFGNNSEDIDFCYFLGLYLAEGTMEYRTDKSRDCSKPYRVTISHTDQESIEFLKDKYGFNCKDGIHSRLSSVAFMRKLLKYFSHLKAPQKYITPEILSLNKECMVEFLKGYFDGDGHSLKEKKRVVMTTSSEKLARQLQILLLNFGIVSRLTKHITKKTLKVQRECTAYRITMESYEAYLFHRDIGFRLTRKDEQKNHQFEKNTRFYDFDIKDFPRMKNANQYHGTVYGKNKKKISGFILESILKNNPSEEYDMQLSYSTVISTEKSNNNTYDFVIPETKQYFANGFISHNTPEGRFNVYGKIMTDHPDFSHLDIKKFTLHWRKHPLKTEAWYEKQKRSRTKLDLAKEVDISYDDSVTGAVYSDFKTVVRQTIVEHDPNRRVYTSWDFGRDSNALIFWEKNFQTNRLYVVRTIRKKNWHIAKFAAFVTGKPTQGHIYEQEDLDFIEWAGNTYNNTYSGHYGDPYNGDAITTNAVESIKTILAGMGIHLTLKTGSTVESRIRDTTLALNRITVNSRETDFIQSMIQSHYPQVKENSQATQERKVPVHDENSHFRTSCEYFIDNEPKTTGLLNQGAPRVFVNKMSGKVEIIRQRATGFGLMQR